MESNIETQKEGYQALINLCLQQDRKAQILRFIDTLTDHNGNENYCTTLNYVMHYLDINAFHFIMALDWKQDIQDLEWRVRSSLKDNFGMEIDLPKPEKYGENKSVSSPNVFKEYDQVIRRKGYQLSFIDTNSDEYVIVVNKIMDSDKVSSAIQKIGYNYLEADATKISGD